MTNPDAERNDRWPPQIKYIVGSEAAERFSYYGMRSVLAVYITTALAQSKDRATTIIHFFVFANYFMPLFGAWISDRFWGRYRTILCISLFYCAGHGVLAMSDLFHTVDAKLQCLYVGLGLIAFGAGGIKPCVSAFMGDQFGSDQQHLMRKAYGVFYFSINFGSFFAFIVIPWIARAPAVLPANAGQITQWLWHLKQAGFSGYSWAFAVPGILMAIATFVFWLGSRHYVRRPPIRETRAAGFFTVFLAAFRSVRRRSPSLTGAATVSFLTTVVLPLLAMLGMVAVAMVAFQAAKPPSVGGTIAPALSPTLRAVGWGALGCIALWYLLILVSSLSGLTELPDLFWRGARPRHSEAEITAARSVAPILAVLALVPAFWALFDQSNSTWVLQGQQMKPFDVFGLTVDAEQMQSLNPFLVMILVPVLTWGLYPFLESCGLRVTPLRRMSLGMVLAAACFVAVGWLQHRLDTGTPMSLAWQAFPYIILTTAEVLVSTTGLEFAFTQAAPSMKSIIMSFWLVTVALGNLLVTTITQLLADGHGAASVSAGRFYLYAMLAAGVALLFMVIAACYRERMFAADKKT